MLMNENFAKQFTKVESCFCLKLKNFIISPTKKIGLKLLYFFQGGSVLGEPQKIESLGETQLPYSVFLDYILSIGDTKFK